jgi:hypothetical protein
MNYGSIDYMFMGRSVGCQIFWVDRWWADILGRSMVGGYFGAIGLLRKLRARDARPYGDLGILWIFF